MAKNNKGNMILLISFLSAEGIYAEKLKLDTSISIDGGGALESNNRIDIDKNTKKNKKQDVSLKDHDKDIAENRIDIDKNTKKNKKQTVILKDHEARIESNTRGITVNSEQISMIEDKVKYVNVSGYSSSIGKGARANAAKSVAVGNNANVHSSAQGSVAVGSGSSVTEGASNSVALGQYSVSSEANTISVGNSTMKRRITNVAYGVNDYDAVNMRQYRFLYKKVNTLDRKVNAVGAMTAAMSALVPNSRTGKNTQVSLGVGAYKSEAAIAVGTFHYVDDDVLINTALSYSPQSGVAGRAGITLGF